MANRTVAMGISLMHPIVKMLLNKPEWLDDADLTITGIRLNTEKDVIEIDVEHEDIPEGDEYYPGFNVGRGHRKQNIAFTYETNPHLRDEK